VTGTRRGDHVTRVNGSYTLGASPLVSRVQDGGAHTSVARCNCSAPVYLADDCPILSDPGRRPLPSNSNDTAQAAHAANTQ